MLISFLNCDFVGQAILCENLYGNLSEDLKIKRLKYLHRFIVNQT